MKNDQTISVLFVCMGNICRSPTAQGVFEQQVAAAGLDSFISVDSAGTHAYHIGEQPDKRAANAAHKRGIDLSTQRARRLHEKDFMVFHYLLAMDRSNYDDMRSICPQEHEYKVKLLLDYAPDLEEQEVPDPYYGGATGFERVLDLIEIASLRLLAEIRQQHDI